jgi:hypothetical protein
MKAIRETIFEARPVKEQKSGPRPNATTKGGIRLPTLS